MIMNFGMAKLRNTVLNNKKIIENYIFITILQAINSFFYILIYPYLISTLGSNGYGTYIYIVSLCGYLVFLINFGLDLPATKEIAENIENHQKKEKTLSTVFTIKTFLFFISFLLIIGIMLMFPRIYEIKNYLLIYYLSLYTTILFPQWFFQGIQNMRLVTYIQVGAKLLSLPFIFIYIKSPNDLLLYVEIISFSTLLGGIVAYILVRVKYSLRIKFVSFGSIKTWIEKGKPFFFSNLAATIKEYSIPIVIGHYFGMREIAIYDLANKIVTIPRFLFISVNSAIFPKLVVNIDKEKIKKVIYAESIVSLFAILIMALIGKYLVDIMGNGTMGEAYYVVMALSVTILTWLVVGAYINFVFILNHKSYIVTYNQVLALISFLLYSLIGLYFYPDIVVFAIAMALSGITEILFCLYITRKYKLL
ncbi:flippase [Actinobacillus pleuropneumoniae]|nr:flippase [Actinobacillus pleuropneumoniae]